MKAFLAMLISIIGPALWKLIEGWFKPKVKTAGKGVITSDLPENEWPAATKMILDKVVEDLKGRPFRRATARFLAATVPAAMKAKRKLTKAEIKEATALASADE